MLVSFFDGAYSSAPVRYRVGTCLYWRFLTIVMLPPWKLLLVHLKEHLEPGQHLDSLIQFRDDWKFLCCSCGQDPNQDPPGCGIHALTMQPLYCVSYRNAVSFRIHIQEALTTVWIWDTPFRANLLIQGADKMYPRMYIGYKLHPALEKVELLLPCSDFKEIRSN